MNFTKLLPPRPVRILERERLTNKLRSWEDKKLVIIHGQAGQGKSTLAADYTFSLSAPSVWYNIDQEDDDPAVFLTCLGQAVQQAYPANVPKLPPVPRERYGLVGSRQGVGRWIDQVFGGLPKPALIVFDEYNNLSSPAALQHLLKTLIEATPPRVRFMLISRVMPELEIARLRAKGAVGEISGDDLRFNDKEAYKLFTSVFGMELAQDDAANINRTTEGWPAGLVLMHEYLNTAHIRGKTAALDGQRQAGFQTHVFDYLAQEVFSQLPGEIRDFLLRTSIADYLSAELISRLTGLPATAAADEPAIARIVEQLRKKNLFVTALDDEATVVRYHALFREFLQKKLHTTFTPSEVRKLHATAARYFKQVGDPVRAVNLYFASGQTAKAAEQIEACGQKLVTRGQTQTILRWLESLPAEYEDRPWLMFYRAVAYRYTDPRRALKYFDRALAGFRSVRSASRRVQGQMLSLGGFIEACFYSGGDFKRMERAVSMASSILKKDSGETGEAKARLMLALGIAYFFIGKLRQGSDALQAALYSFAKIKDYFYQIHSAIYLAPCSIYMGDFGQAREAVRLGFEALKCIPEEAGGEAALYMAQAMTALFEGSFAEAQECIDKCHDLAREHDLEAFDFLSLDIGGWLKTAVGDYKNAEYLLNECKRKGEEIQNAFFNTSAAHLLSVSHLHQGRLGKARAECDYALSIRKTMGSRLFYAVSLSASGAIDLKLGKPAKAERVLTDSLKIFKTIGAAQLEANVDLLLAQLSFRRKKERQAKQYLQHGLQIGKERGFTYYYLVCPADMADLVGKAVGYGICPDYCGLLLNGPVRTSAAPKLKVYTLGGFRVYRGDTLIPDSQWKSKRSKGLLKLLSAHDGQKLPRDVIMEALWPDSQHDEGGRFKFNSMLHRLRKTLEPNADASRKGFFIIQDGSLLYLDRARVWVDVGQFLAHLETAARFKAEVDRGKLVQEYEKALALYQGDFLPEDLYEEWARAVRERLRGLYFKALEDAAALLESMEDRSKAAQLYERLFLADPCNEAACRWLMAWNMESGERGEAIRTYERCQRALSAELDMEPAEHTRKLYRNIIGG